MLLKAIRFCILFLIMLNFPSWVLVNINDSLSSLLSYLSFGLILLYFVLAKQWSFNIWMLILGCLYFSIGTLVDSTYISDNSTYFIEIIKFFIIVLGGWIVVRDTTIKELYFVLLCGAYSVFLQIFVFYNPLRDIGRYSGFYVNPNALGFICIMGYALSYGLDKRLKLLGHLSFTAIGFLTFSRTFIVIWLFMNLVSIRLSLKNLRILVVGFGLLISLITYNSFLPTSNPRLEAMSKIMEGQSNDTSELQEDSRTSTWAIYYTALFSKPILGHGYDAFAGGAKVSPVGPHNAYIKTWGEGGILTLLVMLLLYSLMLKKSWSIFLKLPYLFFMTTALCLFMATNHSYWTNGYLLFFSMWLQYHIFSKSPPTDDLLLQKSF